jgi:molybdenum cofactor cytidylyltransferase
VRASSHSPLRAAIILAAGASRRFGPGDKLRVQLNGRSLLDHAIANAGASGACRILLVTRSGVRRPGLTTVRLPKSAALSASLAAGLAALRPIEREALIFLADMPFAYAPRLRLPPGAEAARPRAQGRPGHPVLVRVKAAKVQLGKGDQGLGRTLRTAFVPGSLAHLLDIDTQAALRRARRHGSRAGRPRSALD